MGGNRETREMIAIAYGTSGPKWAPEMRVFRTLVINQRVCAVRVTGKERNLLHSLDAPTPSTMVPVGKNINLVRQKLSTEYHFHMRARTRSTTLTGAELCGWEIRCSYSWQLSAGSEDKRLGLSARRIRDTWRTSTK